MMTLLILIAGLATSTARAAQPTAVSTATARPVVSTTPAQPAITTAPPAIAFSTQVILTSPPLDLSGLSGTTVHYRLEAYDETGKKATFGPFLVAPAQRAAASAPARRGEYRVQSVEAGRAVLDAGGAQGVRRGDLFRLVSPNRFTRRHLEIDAVEDGSASGKLYIQLLDRLSGENSPPERGDRAEFLAHRRPSFRWGLGMGAGKMNAGAAEVGGGLLLNYSFHRAWSVELLAGQFSSSRGTYYPGVDSKEESLTLTAPIIIKRNFFAEGETSPYIGVGVVYQKFETVGQRTPPGGAAPVVETVERTGLSPMVGFGVEQALRDHLDLRLDLSYVRAKTLGKNVNTFFFSVGFLTDFRPFTRSRKP